MRDLLIDINDSEGLVSPLWNLWGASGEERKLLCLVYKSYI